MKRVIRVLFYYFRWQPMLRRVMLIGAVTLAAGLMHGALLPLRIVGAVFVVGFAVMFGGLAYRLLITNRRMLLVPGIRIRATVALFGLALVATAVAIVVGSGPWPDGAPADPARIALLTFSCVSLFLVASQWLVTTPAGIIGFAVVPFIVLRLSALSDPIVDERLTQAWLWLALAICGWAWLLVTAHRNARPRRPADAFAAGTAFAGGQWRVPASTWLPQSGAAATAAGTILRGAPDGWRNRIVPMLMAMLAAPVAMVIFVVAMESPRDGATRSFELGAFFLMLSFYGVCLFTSMFYAEWPARLRLLWLRTGGDRSVLWCRLERTLSEELGLVAAVVGTAGLAALLLTDVSRTLVLLYVACSVVASFVSGYLGFWIRASGWHVIAHVLALVTILVACFIVVGHLGRREPSLAVFNLLPGLVLLGLMLRSLVRRKFMRLDWCAIRPAR